jgi:bifunctional N-acetylglucosamine-1-phosphate-uridyltransferase/glucosamine-1-phosphate-acetyltransferase GlmU-like protein
MSASQTPVLVVLAAGMGSRFGGDKQLAVLGSTGRTLLHFSVLDAYAVGVRHLVLIVRQNIIAALEQQVLPHFPADLTVQLVLQNPADLPVTDVDISQRQKPWGTAHALWSARQFLQHQSCIVINADDYYGRTAMQLLVQHFTKTDTEWAMVAFPLENTLSAHGGVNRGICQVNDGYLQAVTEVVQITKQQQQLTGIDVNGNTIALDAAQPVSMNIWGFTPSIVPALESALCSFFAQQPDVKAECYLPAVVDSCLQHQQQLRVYLSPDSWFGVTYPADLAEIVDYFQQQVFS